MDIKDGILYSLSNANPLEFVTKLVARGHSIVAEVSRLSGHIPIVYTSPSKEVSKILLDFGYFKETVKFAEMLSSNELLNKLDNEIREKHLTFIVRLYNVLENILIYSLDLKSFINLLINGSIMKLNLEIIFGSIEGKQLMSEALYILGIMLLVVDIKINGDIREKLLVSYYRYNSSSRFSDNHVDQVCTLLRSTGFNSTTFAKPVHYPKSYFSRVEIPIEYTDMVIGVLRTDDIYNQIVCYPHPDHRTWSLFNQTSLMVTCLFFECDILENNQTLMQEIVAKYFNDSWKVMLYLGLYINLIDYWDTFKSARNALSLYTTNINIQANIEKFVKRMEKNSTEVKEVLINKSLNRQNVMSNSKPWLDCLRNYNVDIRWLLIHFTNEKHTTCKRTIQVNELLSSSSFNKRVLFKYLMDVSQYEMDLKKILKELLDDKTNGWTAAQESVVSLLNELATLFEGSFNAKRFKKNEKLSLWFKELAEKVKDLKLDDTFVSNRKILVITIALEEVKEYHLLHKISHVCQIIDDSILLLKTMIEFCASKDEDLVMVQLLTDFSYGWHLMSFYLDIVHENITKNPRLLQKLHCLFLKMASAMDLPLLRIIQSLNEDTLSVSQYYSFEFMLFVQKIIQVIPQSIVQILDKLAVIFKDESLYNIPSRFEKTKIHKIMMIDKRHMLSKYTSEITEFAEGVLAMKSTLVGLIKLDPRTILYNGLQSEINKMISNHFESILESLTSIKPNDTNVETITNIFLNYSNLLKNRKISFEYIQDYIRIACPNMWDQQVGQYLVDSFQNDLKICQRLTLSQSKPSILICIINVLINLTNPLNCSYDTTNETWLYKKVTSDSSNHQIVWNTVLWEIVYKNIGLIGLEFLNKISCYLFANLLKETNISLKTIFKENFMGTVFQSFSKAPHEIYRELSKSYNKWFRSVFSLYSKIGQYYILFNNLKDQIDSIRINQSKLQDDQNNLFKECFSMEINNFSQVLLKDSADNFIENANLMKFFGKMLNERRFMDYFQSLKMSVVFYKDIMQFSVYSLIILLNKFQQGDVKLTDFNMDLCCVLSGFSFIISTTSEEQLIELMKDCFFLKIINRPTFEYYNSKMNLLSNIIPKVFLNEI